ncbi:MAG: alginate export family protein [Candidatus Omnitrophica bacterium]|nr:alginate export family protein [Candidatus Omnitrophota bacterium]
MSRRLILVLALALMIGVTCAYAEVQNVKVSGDIQVQGILRSSLALQDNPANTGTAATGGVTVQDYGENLAAILSQTRVRVDADLTDNVSTSVRLINERVWGQEIGDEDALEDDSTRIALDLAYVTLKEFLYSPLTLTVGRQELRFGNGLIIGDVDTNNRAAGHNTLGGTDNNVLPNSIDDLSLRKSFDAIRATLNYDPVVADLVYAMIDENSVVRKDDVDLYGINVGYTVDKNIFTEGYFWQRHRQSDSTGTNPTNALVDPVGNSKTEILNVIGVRGAYTGIERLSLQFEGAFQWGDHVTNDSIYANDYGVIGNEGIREHFKQVRAWAMQFLADYQLPIYEKYMPMIGLHYTFLSGEDYASNDEKYFGWDPMFEDQMGGTLINKIFGQTNASLITLTGSMKPMEDVSLKVDAHYFLFNESMPEGGAPLDGDVGTVILTNYPGDPHYWADSQNKEAGTEIDVTLKYDYTEDVQFGLMGGAFIPGRAFTAGTRSAKTASQVIGSMKVSF